MSTQVMVAMLQEQLAELRASGQYKQAVELQGPQGAHVVMNGREVLNLSSNNYLGLASDPRVVAAAQEGLSKFGAGTASVRFICGTMTCHLELEQKIAEFIGCEAAL
ncbi:MAG: aminotransferase class I/II-fold pyridoxal phosphate-dependent enzyme, partial [Armatimonadetes bacterium]|nr:aminotransferase class I/II-fold pyridoxal phosphate-dependent enzyme [Armatimonadota bacterium]